METNASPGLSRRRLHQSSGNVCVMIWLTRALDENLQRGRNQSKPQKSIVRHIEYCFTSNIPNSVRRDENRNKHDSTQASSRQWLFALRATAAPWFLASLVLF